MSNETTPFCFPVCFACRTAQCPRTVVSAPMPDTGNEPRRKRRTATPIDPRTPPVRLKCGCLEDIPAVWAGFGPNAKIYCDKHGWQKQIAAKGGKAPADVNPNQGKLDDMPPF